MKEDQRIKLMNHKEGFKMVLEEDELKYGRLDKKFFDKMRKRIAKNKEIDEEAYRQRVKKLRLKRKRGKKQEDEEEEEAGVKLASDGEASHQEYVSEKSAESE
mmetsp:Transcript_14204/g.24148  ORF Transcript_14204/g.24148 Transcript_14204/m.24148 type:complete len:103 (+) Transcript_14204:2235-2543(+)